MNLRKIVSALAVAAALGLLGPAASAHEGTMPHAHPHDQLAAQDGAGDAQVAAVQDVAEDEHVLGQTDAPVTIIEYASLTCPHCASFHNDTLPQLKQEWIETGKAKLVYRHYPLDQIALRAALMTNCFEGDQFFFVLKQLFRTQGKWARAQDPVQALQRIGRQFGMDEQTFTQCVNDQDELRRILTRQKAGRDEANVESTPTFLIDGQTISGAQPYETFEEALNQAYQGS